MLAARTLVSELHVARVGGRLTGPGPRERFRDFLRLTASRAGLASLVTAYPVLARVLAQAAMNAADAFAEMLGRLAADGVPSLPPRSWGTWARDGSPTTGRTP